MLEIAIIVMPVFLVVFAGYIAARVGLVSGRDQSRSRRSHAAYIALGLLHSDHWHAVARSLHGAAVLWAKARRGGGGGVHRDICKFAISGPSDHRARLWRRKPSSDIGPDRRACADLLSCRRHSDGECAC